MAASSFPVRPRMVRVLAEAWRYRVTLVCAEAGYGKSTALASLGADAGLLTVRLTPQDCNASLLAARIAAEAGVAVSAGNGAALAARIAAAAPEVLVVLDEIEHVAPSGEAAAWLAAFVQDAPANVHVLLSGRRLPPLRLEGFEARGLLHRVTAAELAFTIAETELVLGAALAPMAAHCQVLTGGGAARGKGVGAGRSARGS